MDGQTVVLECLDGGYLRVWKIEETRSIKGRKECYCMFSSEQRKGMTITCFNKAIKNQ